MQIFGTGKCMYSSYNDSLTKTSKLAKGLAVIHFCNIAQVILSDKIHVHNHYTMLHLVNEVTIFNCLHVKWLTIKRDLNDNIKYNLPYPFKTQYQHKILYTDLHTFPWKTSRENLF